MKKAIISAFVIVLVGAGVLRGTSAFFADTETSTDNVFAAGAIDLTVDNESYITDETGALIASPSTSWTLDDLTDQLFFNFSDIKPGDIGEDTISLHVDNNDAWLCAAARVTENSDVDYSEPELEDDITVNDPVTLTDGELAQNLNFAFWADDGDNVLETDEVTKIFVSGPVSGLNEVGQVALADSATNVWTNQPAPVTGTDTFYIGKAWCFGTLSTDPADQDSQGKTGSNGPLERLTTGFDCSGADSANNAAQTDRVMGDLQFYAVQSRNNSTFTCGENYTPVWPTPTSTPTPTPV